MRKIKKIKIEIDNLINNPTKEYTLNEIQTIAYCFNELAKKKHFLTFQENVKNFYKKNGCTIKKEIVNYKISL